MAEADARQFGKTGLLRPSLCTQTAPMQKDAKSKEERNAEKTRKPEF